MESCTFLEYNGVNRVSEWGIVVKQLYGRYPAELRPQLGPGSGHNSSICRPPLRPPAPGCYGPLEGVKHRPSKAWLLIPAALFTGVFLAFSTQTEENPQAGRTPLLSGLFINSLTLAASLGIAVFIYLELTEHEQNLLAAFVPVSIGVSVLMVLFAAAYTLTYRIFPDSFEGIIGGDLATQFNAFLHLSINTFATAGDGGITSVLPGARMLVNLELLFFIYIILLGLALFLAK